ncbi:MAG: RimK family protein [Planctomycetes bacterium]|nr:RimK family protein [Planctomycetota bacterium]
MRTIVVTHAGEDWPLDGSGIESVEAHAYLAEPKWLEEKGLRVLNLCRSYRYQSEGYYVSLLAAARRHRPFPDLRTVLDMKSRYFVRSVDEELDDLIQSSLHDIHAEQFVLSIYFGKNLAQRHSKLAWQLFTHCPAPLLRAQFRRGKRWKMTSIGPIALRDVPESHREFLGEAAESYFGRRREPVRSRRPARYDLAILYDPNEELAPSDAKAIERMRRAATAEGFDVELIQREDFGRLSEFDALFIRETTNVDHHTFHFAQRAESEGIVVIDDPESILRCTNKVYQAEAMQLRGIATPKTLVLDSSDPATIEDEIGFPCVLKSPDSSFSQGVVKCDDANEFERNAKQMLEHSELFLAQEFLPTDFDWRIGVFGGEPLYACRYLMAGGHWQIIKQTRSGKFRYGKVEPVALEEVPPRVRKLAVKAAAIIGDGLYGVDIKVSGKRVVVTEVNDNPSLDAGCEDAILHDELYRRIARGLLERIETLRGLNT